MRGADGRAEGLESAATPTGLLQDAIQIHEGHMNGSIPTSDESQMEMMDKMVGALNGLAGTRKAMN